MPVKALKSIALIAATMILVSLACLSESSPISPEPKPVQVEPTITVVVTEATQTVIIPTAVPTQPLAQKFFTEEFDTDNGYWDFNVVRNDKTSDATQASAKITDGVFAININDKNLTIYSSYTPYEYENVRIDLWAENRGTNDNQINIICRATEEGWYEFSISNSGLYKIYAVDLIKGDYRKLHDGGSTKIKPGKEFNEYSVICQDRTLSLYINGVETRVFEENEYVFTNGLIAIGVSSFDTLPVVVEIDSVTISEP